MERARGACHFVMKRAGQLPISGCASVRGTDAVAIADVGVASHFVGMRVPALWFGTHQPKLIPMSVLPTASPRSRFARLERKTS